MNQGRAVPPCMCPQCGYTLDRAGAVDGGDAAPAVGDVTLCIACGEILIFDVGLLVVRPNPAEFASIHESDPEILAMLERAQLAIRHLKERVGPVPSRGGRA